MLPPDTDLVIEPPAPDDDPTTWYYYFASHTNRTLFWIQDYELPTAAELAGIPSLSHLRKIFVVIMAKMTHYILIEYTQITNSSSFTGKTMLRYGVYCAAHLP